jgi:hypothetical protein
MGLELMTGFIAHFTAASNSGRSSASELKSVQGVDQLTSASYYDFCLHAGTFFICYLPTWTGFQLPIPSFSYQLSIGFRAELTHNAKLTLYVVLAQTAQKAPLPTFIPFSRAYVA